MDPIKSIGQLLKGHEQKDAIHMAIIPIIASESIDPGSKVALVVETTDQVKNAAGLGYNIKPIGIVDPFLDKPLKKGDRCWLFLYPGTVTGMRHHFRHPAFPDSESAEEKFSVHWLHEYAGKCNIPYDDLMAGVKSYIEQDDGSPTLEDDHNGWEVPEEFWDHYYNVTGVRYQGHFWGCCI